MLSVFLGMWALGTLSVGYLETREETHQLERETQAAAVQISKEIKNAQEILSFKAQSITDITSVIEAVEIADERELLKILLPLKSSFDLDLIKVIDQDGRLLVNLRSSAVSTTPLPDTDVLDMAESGLFVTSVLVPNPAASTPAASTPAELEALKSQGFPAPLLIKTRSIESSREDIASILVGYALTPEILTGMLSAGRQEMVLLQNSDVIATTLPIRIFRGKSAGPDWSKLSSTLQQINLGGIPYLSQKVALPGIVDDRFQAVVLTPLADAQASQRQMWGVVGGFGTVGGLFVVLIGRWVTDRLTQRITALTTATQNLADGDLTVRLPVSGHDEVAILATGFNKMAEQLNHRDAKIQHQVEELKCLVEALQQMPQQVHTAKMAGLGQMVAGVAHEINNPAGFVYSNVKPAQNYVQDLFTLIKLYQKHFPDRPQVIREQEEDIDVDFIETDLPNLLASMKSGAGRIREIVLNLRNFSHKDEAALKPVNLNEGLESTLVMLSHRLAAQSGNPEIAVIKDYGTLPSINCFASEINQVFMNIIGNALDGIQEKMVQPISDVSGDMSDRAIAFSPTIRIQTHAQDNHCLVKIANNGALIPKDIQRKIFDPFFTTKTVGQGTGLGLSISYQIITKKHNGKIECQSNPQLGTEFVIQLPIT